MLWARCLAIGRFMYCTFCRCLFVFGFFFLGASRQFCGLVDDDDRRRCIAVESESHPINTDR